MFHAERDLSVLLYFVLSAATYFSESVHLALVVLNLNLLNIAICLRLKVSLHCKAPRAARPSGRCIVSSTVNHAQKQESECEFKVCSS